VTFSKTSNVPLTITNRREQQVRAARGKNFFLWVIQLLLKTFLIAMLGTIFFSCLPESNGPEKEKTGFTQGDGEEDNDGEEIGDGEENDDDDNEEEDGDDDGEEDGDGEEDNDGEENGDGEENNDDEEDEPEADTGTLSWTVNLPSGASAALAKAQMSVKDAQDAAADGSPFNFNGSSAGTIEELAAGSWTIEFDMELQWGASALRSVARKLDVIEIEKDQTLNKIYSFEYKDFTLTLAAAAGSGSAYPVIQSMGFDYESPDQTNGGHEGFGPHIVQQYDAALQKNVFAFITHRDHDRNATGDWTRQRVELKVDHRNNAGRDYCAVAEDEGRGFIYRWKFKLPADFAVSTQFSHIHQIKNEGGDASQPIVALTARAASGTDRMQLTYYAPGSSSPEYWVNNANSLDAYRGHWVQCEESVTYSSNPALAAYSLKITRIDNGAVLMNYTAPANTIQTWRAGNTHGRSKFGLYRRIYTGGNPGNNTEPDSSSAVSGLKDETVLFADFEVVRLR